MAENIEPRTVSLAEARALLPELEQSGQTVAEFARKRGIRRWALYFVRREARDQGAAEETPDQEPVPAVDLAPVSIVPSSAATESSGLILELPSGLRIRIPQDFNEITLRDPPRLFGHPR